MVSAVRYQDCQDLQTLTRIMDEQQIREQVREFQAITANLGKGFYFNDAEKIRALFATRIRSIVQLTVGALVYTSRQRNITKASADTAAPAQGVIVAVLGNNEYLVAPLAFLFLNVLGTQPTTGTTMFQIYLGNDGFASFEPADADGSINQKIGVAQYFDSTINRWYCQVNPNSVFVGL